MPATTTMRMVPVQSGMITHIGHEGDTLAVTFASGRTYHYPGFTPAQFAEFHAAASKGGWFAEHVRGKAFTEHKEPKR